MTGLVGGNNGNGAHIQAMSDSVDVRVTTNYYAKYPSDGRKAVRCGDARSASE
jgi:hypothetical protein